MSVTATDNSRAVRVQQWRAAWIAPLVIGPLWVIVWSSCSRLPWAGFGTVAGAVLVMLLLTSSYHDLTDFRIPNWLTYPAMAWSLCLHAAVSALHYLGDSGLGSSWASHWLTPLTGFSAALFGLLAGGVPLLVVYALAGRGAGDVKLAAAIGSLVGPDAIMISLVATYCLAGVYSIARAVWLAGPWHVIVFFLRHAGNYLLPQWIRSPTASETSGFSESVPMAGFFALGTVLALTCYPG